MVLDAWAASPARFREDANAEEALAVGGYAGRVLVELASNAADAARELGVPARIRIRIVDDELRVANSGAPLTAAGVAALASLRASAKRETLDSIGHFGVGFTAALSWTDAPRVVSTTGGIRFAAELTRAETAARHSAGLDREVLLRDGRVPILRLPWPTDAGEEPLPADYPTEVRLPLAAAVRDEVERVLADPATAEDLFWALPALAEIDLPGRVVRCGLEESGLTVIDDGAGTRRYRTADRFGDIPAELLIDRPIEERRRARWRITWALPVDADAGNLDDLSQAVALLAASTDPTEVRRTIGAPTPTDEPITLRARLIGTFPVDDTRRRLAAGPLTDYLLELAADTYLDLLAGTEPADRWKLIPAGGFPAGPVDGAIRDGILRRVASTPLLGTALGDLVKPSEACLLPGLGEQGAVLFGEAIPGLLPPQPSAASSVLRGLGVSILSWSQASSALAGIEREPSFWWHVYEAIATVDRPPDPEDLADIPIPLTGGRRTLGGRGCLLPGTALDPELAHRAGRLIASARIVDPAAVHPLLERLGARPADPELLLAEPLLAEAVTDLRAEFEDADPDSDDIQELAELVLDLIAAAGRVGPGGVAEQVFAGELLLTDDDGRPCPANELFIPGAPLAAVLTAELDQPLIGAEWTDRYSTEVLTAVGVQYSFGVINVADPPPNLPDIEEWFYQFGDDVTIPFPALLDLDLVDDEKWPQALELIATDRTARACLVGGAAGGTGLTYSGWWISRFARIAGRAPAAWRMPEATDLAGLYDPLPLAFDPHFARSIGVQADLADVVARDPAALLTRLADPQRTLSPGRVAVVTAAVVAALRDGDDLDLPPGVRTITGGVVDGADAAVLDQPWLIQVLPVAGLVPGAGDPDLVAGVLDLPLASAVSRLSLTVGPDPASAVEPPPADVDGRLATAAAAVGLDLAQIDVVVSADLRVAVDGGDPVQVTWWGSVDADPADRLTGARYWIDGSAQSCGRVAAWAAGNWSARHRAIAAAGNDWPELAEDSLD